MVAQQSVTEAPAGFTTPTVQQTISPTGELTVNAGSQSVSDGIKEPPGDTFALDQAQFERGMILARGWVLSLTRHPARNAIRWAEESIRRRRSSKR